MIHKLRLNVEAFELVKSGQKVIEARLYDKKRRKIKVGDKIMFFKRPEEKEKIIVKITDLSIIDSFEELFKFEDKLKFGFTEADSLEDQVSCMGKYYTKGDEEKYGAVGIHIKLL